MKWNPRRLLLAGVSLAVLLIAGTGVVRWYLLDRAATPPGARPPAPSAPPAPEWTQPEEPPVGPDRDDTATANPGEEADPLPPPSDHSGTQREPDYGWPEDFELPLHIEVEVPEIPDAMAEPAAPIEDDGSLGQPGDRLTKWPPPAQG